MTMHRQENVDHEDNLRMILQQIGKLKDQILFFIHPRTQKRIDQFEIKLPDNIKTRKPLPYANNIDAIRQSKYVITDSGGIQEECCVL